MLRINMSHEEVASVLASEFLFKKNDRVEEASEAALFELWATRKRAELFANRTKSAVSDIVDLKYIGTAANRSKALPAG